MINFSSVISKHLVQKENIRTNFMLMLTSYADLFCEFIRTHDSRALNTTENVKITNSGLYLSCLEDRQRFRFKLRRRDLYNLFANGLVHNFVFFVQSCILNVFKLLICYEVYT